MKFPLAMVTWYDAISTDDWTHIDDVKTKAALCYSAGLLVNFDQDGVTLSLNYDTQNENLSCFMTIPLGMVVSIQPLTAITKGKSNGKNTKLKTTSKKRVNRKNTRS